MFGTVTVGYNLPVWACLCFYHTAVERLNKTYLDLVSFQALSVKPVGNKNKGGGPKIDHEF